MARILIVEDDRDLATIVRDSLEAQSHTVDHAAFGRLAHDLLGANRYDLLVLDWDLPDTTGFEILREYRHRGETTPVIMLTGRNTFEEKEMGLDAGADDYLTKPFAMKELSARIRSLLRRGGAPAAGAAPAAETGPVRIEPGALIEGKYLLEELISQSKSSSVWRGTHTTMSRPIAVKIISNQLSQSKSAMEMFKQECRAMARLNHPNIIAIFEVGVVNDSPFMILEYAKGDTIRQIVQKFGAAPVKVALDLTMQICNGLQAAHSEGIIHRDLKPENIIFQDQKVIKITDFGVSQLAGAPARMNDDGTVMGNVDYVAPEQLQDAPADPRCDTYSLAVILYEMLTGKLPFEGANPHAILVKKVTEKPPAVSSKRTDVAAGSPIDQIVLRGLAVEPGHRYQSAEQMRADIERLLAGK